MTLKKFSYFSTKAQDWKATSYGDVGFSGNYGVGLKHLKLWSPSKSLKVNSLVLQGKVGVEIEITIEFLKFVNGAIQNILKGKESATAESNYKALKCFKSFSIADYIGCQCEGHEESFIIGSGLKVSGLKVFQPLDALNPLFLIPAEVENTWGLGGSISAFSGLIIGIGTQFFDYNMQQKFQMELNRKPTDLYRENKM